MEGNNSIDTDTDSGDLVEVEIDIDDNVLIASDSSSDVLSEHNDIDNLLDQVNDLSEGGSDSDTGTSVSQNDTNTPLHPTEESDTDDDDQNLLVDMDDLQNDPRNCDEMFDLVMRDPEWSNVFKPIHVNQFRDPSGPNLPQDFDLSSHPVNYFQLFFTDTVISTICENTNKYKKFRCEQKKIVNPQYEEKHWEDVDVPCMKAYIGLSIMFGVLKQARYRTYWSTDEFLGNSAVKSVFTLRRYQKISEYLHISDRSNEIPQGH